MEDSHASLELENVELYETPQNVNDSRRLSSHAQGQDQMRGAASQPGAIYDSPFSGNNNDSAAANEMPTKTGPTSYDDEPPILEGKFFAFSRYFWRISLTERCIVLELGIEPNEIKKKFVAILTQRGFKEVSTYEDMAGALLVLFLFGLFLLLVSKLKLDMNYFDLLNWFSIVFF